MSRALSASDMLEAHAIPVIKRLLPTPVRNVIRRWRTWRIQRPFATLPLAEAFERVYVSNAWGNSKTTGLYSGPGSTGRYVDDYCRLVLPLLREYGVTSVADLGCGNFNTGKAISPYVARYIGVDIAQSVIDTNFRQYASERIAFFRRDLTRDVLPFADAALLRQVLQHLSNSEIRAVLDNVRRTYALAFVTEHLYVGPDARPNLDMPHGPATRVPLRSGISIDQHPFNVDASVAGDIPYSGNEVLRTWVVQGRS